MFNIIILITSIVLSTSAYSAQNIAIEKLLIKSILNTDYDRTTRPANTVEIYLQFMFRQIVSLDDKNQIITTSSTLIVSWFDTRLSWNNFSLYPLFSISVKANQLWLPDLYVINSADSNGFLTVSDSNMASITNNGQIIVTFGLNGNL